MRRLMSYVGCLVILTSCSRESDSQLTSRELAKAAVHAAFEGGAFDALMEQATASAFSVSKARIEGTGRTLTTEQAQRLEASLRRVLAEVYPRDAWEEALLPVFMDGFDRDELQELVEFASTPFGSKLLAAQARLATGGGKLGEQLMQSRQQQLSQRLQADLTGIIGTAP